MSIHVFTEVVGLKELEEALRELRKEMKGDEKNLVANALRAAARDLKKRTEPRVPESKEGSWTSYKGGGRRERFPPGRLKRALTVARHPRPKYLNELVGVGFKAGRTRFDPRGAWYSYIVHKKHPTKAGFLLNAARSGASTSLAIIRRNLATAIERNAKKIGNDNLRKVGARIKKL